MSGPAESLFKDRGSKFFCYAYPVYSEEEIANFIEEVKKLHPKARHHCYAFRLGIDGAKFRANDDGEPSGTAGKPILGQLIKFDLTNTLAIVVRYFGGTLLGTSGLINAYKTSTFNALNDAEIIEKVVEDLFCLTIDYAVMSNVIEAVKKLDIPILEKKFDANAKLTIALRQSEAEEHLIKIKALAAGKTIEEIQVKDPELFGIEKIGTRGA